MLAADKNSGKRTGCTSPPASAAQKRVDLEFASANQQLEGFPGTITEEVAAHEPDLEAITREAKRFGSRLPAEENLRQPPVFPITALSESSPQSA